MLRTNREERLHATEERLRNLFVRGLAGDAQSYRVFLDELSGHIRAFLRKRIVHFADEVEDLVQETLLAVHNQRHTYDSIQPLTPWIHAIAKYKLVDMLRRREYRDFLTDTLDDDRDLISTADSDAAEAKRDLRKLIDQLPDRQRLPIIHTKLEGLSVVDTAQITGMSESAIKVGVHRGLKALAALIRNDK